MNKIFFSAAMVCTLTAGIHIFMGGKMVAAPFLESDFALEPKLTLYAVWHMVSATLVLSAISLFFMSLRKNCHEKLLPLFIGISYLVFGAVFLIICFANFNEALFLKLPQWILLLPIGALTIWGHIKKQAGRIV